MKRYAIWDGTSNVITPIGEVLTPAQWIERHPLAGVTGIKTVCGGGTINGTIFAEFEAFKDIYERQGLDFSSCATDREVLDMIEEFENKPATATVTAEERIASALEAQVLMSMPDVE